MTERHYRWTVGAGIGLIALATVGFSALRPQRGASAELSDRGRGREQDHPEVHQLELRAAVGQEGATRAAHTEEQRAITMLRNDPQMRAEFISKIAAPIANKMFDCGMIP